MGKRNHRGKLSPMDRHALFLTVCALRVLVQVNEPLDGKKERTSEPAV